MRKDLSAARIAGEKLVAWGGIEPPTRGLIEIKHKRSGPPQQNAAPILIFRWMNQPRTKLIDQG